VSLCFIDLRVRKIRNEASGKKMGERTGGVRKRGEFWRRFQGN